MNSTEGFQMFCTAKDYFRKSPISHDRQWMVYGLLKNQSISYM